MIKHDATMIAVQPATAKLMARDFLSELLRFSRIADSTMQVSSEKVAVFEWENNLLNYETVERVYLATVQ